MEQAQARLRAIQAALALAYAVLVVWFMIVPAHTRALVRMRALTAAQKTAASAARRTGRASMLVELTTGRENYALPYRLSLAAERAALAVNRIRNVST